MAQPARFMRCNVSMNTRFFAVVLGCALLAGTSGRAAAQDTERAVALSAGDTVRILNRVVVDRSPGQRGARIDVYYATRLPASDVSGRADQADRLAQIVGADASRIGARRFTLSICETRACAETREQPKQWYAFERGVGGIWL